MKMAGRDAIPLNYANLIGTADTAFKFLTILKQHHLTTKPYQGLTTSLE